MSGGPVPLAHAAAEQRYGGKAANLARLLRAGVQTQPGLVLGVEVLQEHLARLGIAARVESFFAAVAQGGSGNTAAEAAGLRRAVLDAELPAGLVQAIRAGLEDGAVHAVRSSAPGEDGATTSFAGQFDSVLGCRSLEAVVEAVRVVWASLFSERAVAYAVHRHRAQRGMAVIIQRQVDATVSGVMFSHDPRNSSGSELLVEYCAGLGEKLVAGQVSPGRFYIHRDDGAVRVDALPGEQVTPDPAAPEIAAALRQTALTIESLYGGPQDVEWSLDPAGQLVVLQARPITTGAQQVPQAV